MQLNQRYKDALDNLSAFTERHMQRLEEYLTDLGLAAREGAPPEGTDPSSHEWKIWEAEFAMRAEAIRMSEKYREIVDKRDILKQEKDRARVECLEKEDHPLYTDRTKRKEEWIVQLDERNYDMSSAKTLEDKLKVEDNIRRLIVAEHVEKEREEKRISEIRKMRAEQRRRGVKF